MAFLDVWVFWICAKATGAEQRSVPAEGDFVFKQNLFHSFTGSRAPRWLRPNGLPSIQVLGGYSGLPPCLEAEEQGHWLSGPHQASWALSA